MALTIEQWWCAKRTKYYIRCGPVQYLQLLKRCRTKLRTHVFNFTFFSPSVRAPLHLHEGTCLPCEERKKKKGDLPPSGSPCKGNPSFSRYLP
jgi:hypothetical protein